MVNRLSAEKFVFFHFAGAELRRGKQPGLAAQLPQVCPADGGTGGSGAGAGGGTGGPTVTLPPLPGAGTGSGSGSGSGSGGAPLGLPGVGG